MAESAIASKVMISPSNSGRGFFKTCGGIHSLETPPGPKWAESLGGPDYMQNPANKVSVQYIADSDSAVQTGYEDAWCWGAGSLVNKRSIQIEQAGYADFTRPQWLGLPEAIGTKYTRPNGTVWTYTAEDARNMAAQFEVVASLVADICKRHGWKAEPMTDDELRRAANGEEIGKWWTHAQVSRVAPTTTNHHDPGKDYPLADMLARARQIMGGDKPPAPEPTPEPAPSTDQEIEMFAVYAFDSKMSSLPWALLAADGTIHWIDSKEMLDDMKKKLPNARVSVRYYNANRAPGTNEIR